MILLCGRCLWSSVFSVCPLRPGLKVAQHREFRFGRRRSLFHCIRKANLPPGLLRDVLARDAPMDRCHNEFLRLRVWSQQAEVGHDERWAERVNTEALAVVSPGAVPKGGDEIHPIDEGTACLAHDDIGLAAEAGDLRRTSPAWHPNFRVFVAADDAGVDVAKALDFPPAAAADRGTTSLRPVLEPLPDRPRADG